MADSAKIDSLPNEVLSKIVYFAANEVDEETGEDKIDHKFIVDVISKVSTRFKDIASDP